MAVKTDSRNLVVFRLGEDEFAFDVRSTREVVRLSEISPVPRAPEFIDGVINLRGHAVAVMDLGKRFGIRAVEKSEKSRIMIVRASRMIVGLIVDAVLGVRNFTGEEIQPTPAIVAAQVDHRFISGVLRVDDRTIFLINLDEILTRKNTEALRSLVESPKKDAADAPGNGGSEGK
jgi:purine-binding chemotaxis protein CheW